MKRFISIIICISLILTLCSCSGGLKRFEKTFYDCFDTVSTIVAYDTDQSSFDAKYEELHNLLIRYNNLYDIYESHDGMTCLKDVNEQAALSPVNVDKEIIDLLNFGKKMYVETNGTVNICMGAVLSIWHEYREEGTRLPDEAELKEAANHCFIDDLFVDSKKGTVFFTDREMSIDVGAIAKGYVSKRIIEIMPTQIGWSSALLNLGGNVATLGTKPDGSAWNVQIENPDQTKNEALDTLQIKDNSVVTSGDYQRYYEVDGKRYCHIIDTDTLYPADEFTSVTVIYTNPAVADALSTALFILPIEDGKKLLQKYDGAKAVWVDKHFNKITN